MLKTLYGDDPAVNFVSPYSRAVESAHLLGGETARWTLDYRLCERSWGDAENTPQANLPSVIEEIQNALSKDPMRYRPGGGQSMIELLQQVQSFLDLLTHSEFQNEDVRIVGHGESIHAFRHILETRSWGDFERRLKSTVPVDCIPTAGFFHYSGKKDPSGFGNFTQMQHGYPRDDGQFPVSHQETLPHDPVGILTTDLAQLLL